MASCIGSGSAAFLWAESLTQNSELPRVGLGDFLVLGSRKIRVLLYGIDRR